MRAPRSSAYLSEELEFMEVVRGQGPGTVNVLLAATHSNSFTTPDTKRTKGQGPGLVNVLLAATHSNSFTTCGLKGQGTGMVNVLLAASPATRSRPVD